MYTSPGTKRISKKISCQVLEEWQQVNISDGTTSTSLSGIVVNGQDVYAVGNSVHTNGNTVATYWKNGVASQLTSGVSFAWNIFVFGNDVYTTGSIRNTQMGIDFVSYWKIIQPHP